MSTFAPLQFLKSAQNPLVWTAIDNGTDTRTNLILYYGAVNTLPTDTEMYEVNCIMMHQAEKQLYANTGTSTTPSWEAFGPNSAFPQPLVPGSFLFTDGATVYWATQLVGQVQYNATNLNQYGILNFNSLLVASNDVPNSRINVDLDVVALAGDATFISNLEGNLDLANIGGQIDLSTQVTGVLPPANIDITGLEGDLDLGNIAGSLDLTTQVTGQLPASNIDITDLESNLTLGNIGGSIDLTTQVTGQLDAANIDVSSLDEQIKVAVDGVTIIGDGTTGNPLIATGTSGIIIVDTFDDFINWIETVDSSGSKIYTSGNFYFGDLANGFGTETNHPGTITIPTGLGNAADVIGFIAGGQDTGGDAGGIGLIPVGNDFKFTYIGKSTRAGASFDTIIGFTDDTAGYDVYVRFNNGISTTKVTYYDGTGPGVSTIDLPASGAWFTLIFDYIASTTTLTITLDGQTVFSGTPTFADTQVGFRFGSVGGTAGTSLTTDLVTCVYKATR